MRAPSRTPATRQPQRFIIGPHTPEFSGYGIINFIGAPLSGGWTGINDPVGMSFRISRPAIIDQLGWMKGTSVGGNFDIGVYDAAWARLVSTGSTAGAGTASEWQFTNVADTALSPGVTYYLVMSSDNTTANRLRYYTLGGNVGVSILAGVQDSATDAFPLPNPLTNMAPATVNTFFPICAIALKTPFA